MSVRKTIAQMAVEKLIPDLERYERQLRAHQVTRTQVVMDDINHTIDKNWQALDLVTRNQQDDNAQKSRAFYMNFSNEWNHGAGNWENCAFLVNESLKCVREYHRTRETLNNSAWAGDMATGAYF